MKTAKKVLSVVLAIAMALSCFAVAASAYGPDNATYNAKWWLTASTGSYTWAGTKMKPKVGTVADNCENYKNEIIVEAGDVVWIKMYTTTDYYPEGWVAPLFYSKNLLNSADIYKEKWSALPGTSANLQDFAFANENNYLVLTSGGAAKSFIDPTLWHANPDQENIKYFPTADNDPDTKLLTTEDYKYDVYFWLHDASNADMNLKLQYNKQLHYDYFEEDLTEEEWNDTYGWIMEVPFKVPAGAASGTKYTVTIPELTMKRDAKKDGILQFSMCADQGEEVTNKNAIMYSADQNFDFSEATIDIYVHEKPGGLDYTDLEAAIEDFDKLTETDWTADSWADAKDAYDAAVALVDNAETQDEIDDAADALNAAIDALVEAGPDLDFTELEAAIGKTPDDLSAYTTSSADAVVAAWSDAMLARSADNQDDIDAATIALNEALDALELKVDASELAEALAAAGAVDDIDDWYELDVDDLNDAVAAGQALMADADDTSADEQTAFDDAADAINYILEHHMYSAADYSRIVELQDQVAALNEADYTAASWATLEAALDAVKPGLLRSKQGQVDEMAENIELAIDGLKEIAYTASLELYVAQADAADEAEYAADVWAAIQDKVALANTYIGAGLAREDVQADIDALAMELINLLNTKLADADYTAVYAALEKVPADIVSGLYTEESKAILDAACEAVDFSLKADKQAQVDAMAQAIEDALDGLRYKAANLGALATALAKAQDVDPELVSADSYLALDLAMATAGNLMGSEIDIRDQADVDAAVEALNKAYDELVWLGADYSALNQAKADFEALDEDLYTVDSYAAAATAYDAATKVAANLGKADQDIIDNAATALSTAINELAYAACDYTALNAAKTAANLSNFYSNSTMPKYKDDLWTAYSEAKTAAEAIEAGLTKENGNQDKIDAAAAALADATAALKLDSAYASYDYTDTNALVDVYNNPVNADNYTTASWEAFVEKVEALNMDYTMKAADYTKAQTQYKNLKKAYDDLVPAAPADYTAVNAAIASFDNYNENEYTAESWKAVEDAIANVTTGLNENHQGEVDAMAAAINDAIGKLVKAAAPIDYTALESVYNYLKDIDLTNCVAGKADFETALANAADMLDAKNAETQSQVNALATAISAAFAKLKFAADYTILNDLIANAEKLNENDWTAESWANLEDALADAKAVPADLTADDQTTIDDAADALSLALESLQKYVEPDADYTELISATLLAAQKDQSLYTAESWAVLEAALAEAEIIPAGLKASSQKRIDDAAAAINAAIAGLTPKPPVEGGTVKDVEFVVPTKDTHNTFTITVNGRPSFLQFVELDHGNGTRSYDRYNVNASIVSYDAAGNVIDDRGDVAYEVWTIYTNLNEGTTGVRAKYGKVWEDLGDAYNFNYAVDRSSSAVISAELAATSGKTGPVITTVVTGPDVEYIQLKSDDGATATYAASKAVKNEDGTLTFTGKSWFNHEGNCVVTIRVLAANKWTDATTLTYTAGSEEQIINLPEEFVW